MGRERARGGGEARGRRNSDSKSNTVFVLVLDTVFWEVIQFGLHFRNVLNATYNYSYNFRNSVSKVTRFSCYF